MKTLLFTVFTQGQKKKPAVIKRRQPSVPAGTGMGDFCRIEKGKLKKIRGCCLIGGFPDRAADTA